MATTTRKKKEKIVVEVKEGVKLPPLPVEDEVVKETLEPEHLKNLEVFSRDIENASLSMAVSEQELQNMILSLENLQLKIEKQKIVVANRGQKYEVAKQKYTNYKKQIWPQYGLKETESMSYDIHTGEIKRTNM